MRNERGGKFDSCSAVLVLLASSLRLAIWGGKNHETVDLSTLTASTTATTIATRRSTRSRSPGRPAWSSTRGTRRSSAPPPGSQVGPN